MKIDSQNVTNPDQKGKETWIPLIGLTLKYLEVRYKVAGGDNRANCVGSDSMGLADPPYCCIYVECPPRTNEGDLAGLILSLARFQPSHIPNSLLRAEGRGGLSESTAIFTYTLYLLLHVLLLYIRPYLAQIAIHMLNL